VAVSSQIFIDDFKELVESCSAFAIANRDRMRLGRVGARRAALADFAEVFHRDCGTLTPSVKKRLEDLRDGLGLVLMTAHQPNFFAYSGVFRKATLNFVLAKKLEELLKVPVVSFFGIADQDFTDDRWVRSCQLPAVKRSGGILSIDVKLPERLMLNSVARPSVDALERWRSEIEGWLDAAVKSVHGLCKKLGLPELSLTSSVSALHENFVSFWNIIQDCHERAERFSDFNAFVMSRIVNASWGYDTVFARFSECQRAFVEEFSVLLSRFEEYSELLREAMNLPEAADMSGGVSDQEPFLAPFWYHCDCGSKVRLFLAEEDGLLFGRGDCLGCEESYELEFGAKADPDLEDVASRISARAIPMGLVFFSGLMPSCYVGGLGGARYLMEAEHVAEGLGIPFPPITFWRPHDKYRGVGQLEAGLELKRICKDLNTWSLSEAKDLLESRISEVYKNLDRLEASKNRIMEKFEERPENKKLKEEIKRISLSQTEVKRSLNLSVINHKLKILENITVVLNMIPSIIDYAVNVGLKETSDQWVRYLNESGSLSSDVHLEPLLSQNYKIEL
jgi:hypothetical protein